MKKSLLAGCLMIALVGCVPATPLPSNEPTRPPFPEYDPNNPGPWCVAASEILGNPWATPAQQQAALTTMNNRGCFQ
jgi:hypothetical protein